MSIEQLVSADRVLLNLRVGDKKQLLQELARHAGALLQKPAQPIYDALLAREALGSTGLGRAFALPHARIPALEKFFGLFARMTKPLAFDAVDGKPVDLVFLLLMPASACNEQVTMLASISRVFRDENIVATLRKAHNANEVLAAFGKS